MTEHAHHNIASAASPDDAAREAAPPDELRSSSTGQPSAPEARAKASRAQRFAAVAAALTLLFAAAVLATQAFNVELFDAHHPFSFGAPDIEVVETMLDASGKRGSGACGRPYQPRLRRREPHRACAEPRHASDVRARDAERGRRAAQRRRAVARPRRDVRLRRRVAWQRGQDGRYYLAVALEPDQTTPVLIDSFEVEAGALAGIDQLKLVIKVRRRAKRAQRNQFPDC